MGFTAWAAQNWFDLLQSVGIVASLLFTAHTVRQETKTRRVSNLMTLTENHRKIWSEFSGQPGLERVLDERADLREKPVTREEEIFVNFVIFQMQTTYYAQQSGLIFKLEGLRQDIAWLLSLPIPHGVWEKTKKLQNKRFVTFIESCTNWK